MSYTEDSKQLREKIRILERKLGVLQDAEYSCCNISMAQCHALVEIGRAGSISLSELAELLNLENSTMSRTVNNLVNSGLVEREIDPKDRRYVSIKLTQSGMKVFEGIEKNMDLYFQKVLESISSDKQKQVVESLQILIEAISENEQYKK
ncbi:MAG: MarR family transcriptional regulator [Clostridiaceae bacterium]|jgi:DNA-binding MarR family transcriptional regulator|nr:MarR family transcriptional regulator [Clostridiaceae bacterium]